MLWVASLVLAGCAGSPERWTLTVYNDHIHDPIVVRVHTARGVGDWLLQPQQVDTLIVGDSQMAGLIEVLDPTTCERLVQREFAPEPSLYVRLDRGMDGEGAWFLRLSPFDPDDADGMPPNFAGCEGL
jgi:hypothetical protein